MKIKVKKKLFIKWIFNSDEKTDGWMCKRGSKTERYKSNEPNNLRVYRSMYCKGRRISQISLSLFIYIYLSSFKNPQETHEHSKPTIRTSFVAKNFIYLFILLFCTYKINYNHKLPFSFLSNKLIPFFLYVYTQNILWYIYLH